MTRCDRRTRADWAGQPCTAGDVRAGSAATSLHRRRARRRRGRGSLAPQVTYAPRARRQGGCGRSARGKLPKLRPRRAVHPHEYGQHLVFLSSFRRKREMLADAAAADGGGGRVSPRIGGIRSLTSLPGFLIVGYQPTSRPFDANKRLICRKDVIFSRCWTFAESRCPMSGRRAAKPLYRATQNRSGPLRLEAFALACRTVQRTTRCSSASLRANARGGVAPRIAGRK